MISYLLIIIEFYEKEDPLDINWLKKMIYLGRDYNRKQILFQIFVGRRGDGVFRIVDLVSTSLDKRVS